MEDKKDIVKKKASGAENRKRKTEKEKVFAQSKKHMNINKYFKEISQVNTSSEVNVLSESEDTAIINHSSDIEEYIQRDQIEESIENSHDPSKLSLFYVSDVMTWPKELNASHIDNIVLCGPSQVHLDTFPKDKKGRHFSSSHYLRKLPNGETIKRRWLVYSTSGDSVFCFCCRLFDLNSTSNLTTTEGFKNWQHLSESLKMHENNSAHKKAFIQWTEAEMRLKSGLTIDKEEQKLISKERLRWNNVLQRLMHITLYLAENNMAFRGSSDKLFTPNNGKFLGLIQLLAKFDPIMEEHVRLTLNGKLTDHYCGKNIQNELIELMSSKVTSTIVSRIKASKYYSIIADCTPDISHKEQLSITLRCTDITEDAVSIKEYFISFLNIEDTTGAGITESILKILNDHGLNINDCRGQGYDNGANMKGKNKGVQKRILEINPLAFFVPCGCHSYNLVLCDAAKSSVKSVTLFGILQKLFNLFAGSVNRWKILTDHLKTHSLKNLSDTRWEARIESVKAVRYQLCEVHDALVSLADVTTQSDAATSHEATTLAEQIKNFSFIVSLIVWYDVLFQFHVVSKVSQSPKINLIDFSEMLQKCCSYLETYRQVGFEEAIVTATQLASELDTEPVFKPLMRIRRIRRRPGEEAVDEPITDPKKKFEIEFFNILLDTAIISMKERFQQMEDFSATWNFLNNLKVNRNREELMQHCLALQDKLTVNLKCDIDGVLLCDEILGLQHYLKDSQATPIETLNLMKKHHLLELYPNTWIALRILVITPVTVASGERSFSKLKLIKTYLRSTMSQARLTGLATLSIENEIAENIDFACLIGEFSDKKARKIKF